MSEDLCLFSPWFFTPSKTQVNNLPFPVQLDLSNVDDRLDAKPGKDKTARRTCQWQTQTMPTPLTLSTTFTETRQWIHVQAAATICHCTMTPSRQMEWNFPAHSESLSKTNGVRRTTWYTLRQIFRNTPTIPADEFSLNFYLMIIR